MSGMSVISAHVSIAEGTDPRATPRASCGGLSDGLDTMHPTFDLGTVGRRRVEERACA